MAQATAEKYARRNLFYRTLFTRVFRLFVFSMTFNVLAVCTLIYLISHIPTERYYATSVNSRVSELVPLEQPNQSEKAVLQWAVVAAISMGTYDFVNYNRELEKVRKFFTANGWSNFTSALLASQNLKSVVAKKLIVSAVAVRPPVVLAKGIINGRYSWRVQTVMLLTFQSPGSEPVQQGRLVTMLIRRISTRENPRGIGIEQIVIGPGSIPGVSE